MLKKICMAIGAFLIFIVQTTFHHQISIGSISPNLTLAFVCCIGFIHGKKSGLFLGFFTGFLLDIFYGYSGVIGMTGLLYMYLGYINGLFNEVFYSDDICIPVLLTMVCDLVYNFIYYCVTFLLRGDLDVSGYFKNIMFPEMLYTGFVTVFLFRLWKVLSLKLEKFEKRGEEKLVKRDFGNSD